VVDRCLLHSSQLHVSALMAVFRLMIFNKNIHKHLHMACVFFIWRMGALMFTGYSTVSSVVLWLMLEYFCFSYLIRIVVFINRYRSLDCCTVLSGIVFLQILFFRYNRTDKFLVTEFFLTTTIVIEVFWGVCNSTSQIIRKTYMYFVVSSAELYFCSL